MDQISKRRKAMLTIEQHCNALPLVVLERLASLVASIGKRVDETVAVEWTVEQADTEPPAKDDVEPMPPTVPSAR